MKPLKLSKTPKPGLCPAMRCLAETGGDLCSRHKEQAEKAGIEDAVEYLRAGRPQSARSAQAEKAGIEGDTADVSPAEPTRAETTTVTSAEPASMLASSTQNALVQAKTEAEQVLEALTAYTITSNADMKAANQWLGQVKAEIKAKKSQLESATKPMNTALKEIRSWFKPVIDVYLKAESILKHKIDEAILEAERAQDEALAQVQAAGGQVESHVLAVAHGRELPETPDVVSVRKLWRFRIVDAKIIPREFCCPDERLIGAYVQAKKGDCSIPGVEVYVERNISRREVE